MIVKKNIEKGSEEWQFFQDFWRFRQKYYEPEERDEWFEEIVAESTKLYAKYQNTDFKDFAKALIIAHIDDVDRRCTGK